MYKSLLMNLNSPLFSSDGGEFGAYDPSSAYEGIETPEPAAAPEAPFEQPNQEIESFQESPQSELLDFGGRKIEAVHPELQGLHKDFTEQQRYITSLQEQVKAYQQIANMTQQSVQQAPQEPQISSNVQEWNEETWQQFYDKPEEIIGNLVQRMVGEKIEPIIQERQWNNEIQNMYNAYPDFDQFIGDVQSLVEQHPERYADRPGGLEEAYFRAKAEKSMYSPTPEQLAQDPDFINQYVMNNPQVQTQIVQQYLQQKQQGNQQIPPVMGRGTGGFTPQTPENSPQTLREASRQFMKSIGYR